jgi:multiple sugar transport system substrate-binding protein
MRDRRGRMKITVENEIRIVTATTCLLLLSLVAVLSGCGGSDETVITVINQSRWVKNIDDAAAEWNETHPQRRVKLNQLVIGYPQLKNKLMTAAGAGRPPDLSLIDSVWLASFAETGHLAPLDSLAPDWFARDYKKDFFRVFQESDIEDGHLWGARAQTDMALLWYRKDWLSREGLAPPETWDDLVAVAEHFKQNDTRTTYDISQYPLAVPLGRKAQETLIYLLLPLFWSNGGGVFDGDSLVLESGNSEETLEFIRSLVAKYEVVSPEAISFEWNRATQLFATGKVPLAFGGSYEKRMIQEISGWTQEEFMNRVGFTLIPAGPHGKPSTTAGGMCYVIYRLSDHKGLAMEILKLAVSPQIQKDFLLDTFQNPPRKSIAAQISAQEYPFLARTSEYLYRARARPSFPEYSQLSDVLQEMIEDVARGAATPARAVEEATEKIQGLMAESRGPGGPERN